MDCHYRKLANQLFATATAILGDAIEATVAGQSPRLPPSKLADHGCRLQATARDIAILAEAATIVANLDVDQTQNRLKRPR